MIKSHIKRVLIGATLGVAAATVYWKLQPRIYQGNAQVFINSGGSQQAEQMSALLALGISQSALTEGSIIRSEGTFKQACLNVAQQSGNSNIAQPETMNDLYLMYDIEMSRDSRVMLIKVKAYDPRTAADIANEIVNVYNAKRKQTSSESYSNAQYSVVEQLKSTKRDLDGAEMRIKRFKEQTGMLQLGSAAGQIAAYQATLVQQKEAAESEDDSLVKSISAEKAEIDSRPKTVELNLAEVKSPILDTIEMDITNYEKQRTELLRVYTPTSARVKEIDDLIARTRQRLLDAQKNIWRKTSRTFQVEPIRAAMESQLAQDQIKLVSLRARQRSMSKEIAAQNALAASLPAKERQLAELSRDYGIFQNNYTRFKAQLTELKLQSSTSFMPAVNLYPAQTESSPISPLPSKILPLGLIAGGILGLLYGFLRESLRSTVRTSDEVSSLFELPVVATVPALPDLVVRRNLQGLSQRTHTPQETFRFMASAAALAQGGPRSVVFTSSGGNVGCSSAAGEFAVAAAKMGVRTVLVDADTTFGTLTKVFKMENKPGLRDLLGRRLLATEDVPLTIPTDHPNLTVLPIGGDKDVEISDTPNALLHGLLESLERGADLVVIDCPPVDVMADTSRFVSLASEVCLVVSARKTSLQSITLARALLERCGARTVSVVLTGALPKEEAFKPHNRYTAARR